MTTASIRVTGDMSGLSSNVQNATKDIDRLNESLNRTSDLSGKMSDVNINVGQENTVGGYSNTVSQALNNVSQSQQQVAQVIQTTNSATPKPVVQSASSGGGGGLMSTIAQDAMMSTTGGGMITKFLAGLGPVGLGIGAGVAALGAANKLSNQWLKAQDVMDTYAALGTDIDKNSANQNSINMLNLFEQVAEARRNSGTRYKTDEYLKEMTSLQRYGYTDTESALDSADRILKWQNFGAGSREQLSSFEGLTHRFEMGEKAIQTAYAGLQASGMQKGQFDEFLSSMEDILEEGISKGFVRAADEVATDLTMLEELSGGNKLWQGQYGAEKLSRMNSAMENATSLTSVNDVMLYQAMAGLDEGTKQKILGTDYDTTLGYINNMMLLERGINIDNIGAVFGAVNDQGGSAKDKIERYANMFGVNYTTAKQIYDLSNSYSDSTKESVMAKIDALRSDPKNLSNEAQYLNTQETIKDAVITAGGHLYDIKAKLLGLDVSERKEIKMAPVSGDEVATWDKLVESYAGPMSKEDLTYAINEMFNDEDMREWADKTNFQDNPLLKEAWESGDGTKFFTTLFNPELFSSTAYGPMSTEDIEKTSEFWGMRTKKRKKGIEKFEAETGGSFEDYAAGKGLLEALLDLTTYIKTGSFKTELVATH